MNFIKKFFKQLFYKNKLTSNSNKVDLDELDEALLVFLVYIDCTGYGFFNKSVWKSYHCKYISGVDHAIQIDLDQVENLITIELQCSCLLKN